MTFEQVWERLARVRSCRLRAVSAAATGAWNRTGDATVTVEQIGTATLEWRESGSWQEHEERPTTYRNRLRWEWDVSSAVLRLLHVRRGPEHPVHLADFIFGDSGGLAATLPHLCGPDRYLAELQVREGAIELSWAVYGPEKGYRLTTLYTPEV